MIKVNSRKFDGSIRRSWTGELLSHDNSLLVLKGEFDEDVEHPDLGHIRKDTQSYEYYWLDRWYNIFRFHEPSGELRNFYLNIAMPPQLSDGVLNYVDLDIDILVQPDFSYEVLDEEDYERNAEAFRYPTEVRERVQATLNELLELIDSRLLPQSP